MPQTPLPRRRARRAARASALSLLLLGAAASPLLAQNSSRRAAAQPAAPAAEAEAPQRTSAQFGDWSVNCAVRPGGERQCEMALLVQNRERQTVAVLAMGRPARDAATKLVAQLPVNALVNQPVRLLVDEQPVLLPFRACAAQGCFAELELRDDALARRLRARPAEQPARLEWRDAAGAEVAVPVSSRGFAAAADALAREN